MSTAPIDAAPGLSRRRPLVYTVEAPEGGATELHRLAPAPADAAAAAGRLWSWTGVWAAALAAAAVIAATASLAAPRSRPLAAAVAGIVLLVLRRLVRSRSVVAESILVIKGMGIQLQTHFADGQEAAQFLDLQRVRAVLINEGITMHRVVYYLAFVVEGRDRLLVAFPRLQPRLEELLPVYERLRPLVAAARAERDAGATVE